MGKHKDDSKSDRREPYNQPIKVYGAVPPKRHTVRCRKKGLSKELIRLVRALVKIKAEGKKLGLFMEDRDLIACPRCGLEEDVACGGMLLVTTPADRAIDTGLRFTQVKKDGDLWRCPGCGFVQKCEWL